MDVGRWIENVVIERWFRSLKIKYTYPNEYITPRELRAGITKYINEYNHELTHQDYGYKTPCEVYFEARVALAGLVVVSYKPRPRRWAGASLERAAQKGYGTYGSQGSR